MALPTITKDDFRGWLKLVVNDFKEELLDAYIEQFLEVYLREILGDAAFIAIKNQDRQKWADLFEGVDYKNSDGDDVVYDGLRRSIVTFIYFQFVRDNFTSTQTGKVKPNATNSENNTPGEVLNIASSRYNSGVAILNNSTPEYLETYEEIVEGITSSTDNTDNTYTLTVDSTLYLEDTDMVTIDDVEYAVSNVVADTSFDINAGATGLVFSGDAIWKPFEVVEFEPKRIVGI